jgi:hypothetical protein
VRRLLSRADTLPAPGAVERAHEAPRYLIPR